ncbi:MAG: ATP synthase F1 subunit gamma [Candidatus Sumerlaeia bacterium]|nr:ATP synthase F1 subunit gamma [Candidatus Sumerlaeia bacterium]
MAEILRNLRRRVRSIRNTMQVTRAMGMVSAAKLRRTQAALAAARPYAEKIKALLARVAASVSGELAHPLFARRGEKTITLVLFTGDRGLCGAFNANVIRQAEQFLEPWGKGRAQLYCVGRRGRDHFARRGWTLVEQVHDVRGRVDLDVTRRIARRAQEIYLNGETDAVYLAYNVQLSAANVRPKVEKFLPLDPAAMGLEDDGGSAVEYIFEPSREAVFAQLLPRFCESRMFAVLAEALTAEHTARMMAMNNATSNCDELINTITLRMNKARQAAITKEISEIMGGAEALAK